MSPVVLTSYLRLESYQVTRQRLVDAENIMIASNIRSFFVDGKASETISSLLSLDSMGRLSLILTPTRTLTLALTHWEGSAAPHD